MKQVQPFEAFLLNRLYIYFEGIVIATFRTPLWGLSQSQLTSSSGKSAPANITGHDRSKRALPLAELMFVSLLPSSSLRYDFMNEIYKPTISTKKKK